MKVILENGLEHELTNDEMKVLRIAIEDFNKSSLPLCSEKREQEYLSALNNLQSIFQI